LLEGIVNVVKNFRDKVYHLFHCRQDAAMDVIDALSSNQNAKSVVQLSVNPVHKRNYCSITRVVSEYYKGLDTKGKTEKNHQLTQILSQCSQSLSKRSFHLFGVDCTSLPRVFSKTLSDRSCVHSPNPISGNKPITIGHQYSLVAYLPEKSSKNSPPWILPLSYNRVPSDQKGTVLGMEQINTCIGQPAFQNALCVSVGDCAYSQPDCIVISYRNKNQVHLSRVKNNRIFYNAHESLDSPGLGRPKCYGTPFKLNDIKTHRAPDELIELSIVSQNGKENVVKIECWNQMMMRGKQGADMTHCHFRLIRIKVFSKSGELLFKRPMWLIVSGIRQEELSLIDIYDSYRQRFDLEHFFRFGKNKLLLDKSQTPEVEHEEAFSQLVILAYAQLYISRELAKVMPHSWEKYLPEFKSGKREVSPSQVQKDFERIIRQIGTPAKFPKPRNKSLGRAKGEIQSKRLRQNVIFKSQKSTDFTEMVT
jgi:DDE superfamily endonuclease